MSLNRFKMHLNNGSSNTLLAQTYVTTMNKPSTPSMMSARTSALNAPMISRVYNAKPGCSACGKKVS